MTTANPNERDDIPDERTEEEELQEQISVLHGKWSWHEEEIEYSQKQMYIIESELNGLELRLKEIRKENANFLRDYAPGAIGSDAEDSL